MQDAVGLGCCIDETEQVGIEEGDAFLVGSGQFLVPEGVDPGLDCGGDGHAKGWVIGDDELVGVVEATGQDFEFDHFDLLDCLPDLHRLIIAPRGDATAVGRPHHRIYSICMLAYLPVLNIIEKIVKGVNAMVHTSWGRASSHPCEVTQIPITDSVARSL